MVVLMDLETKEKGDFGGDLSASRMAQTTKGDQSISILQNLPSSIPNSCIYRKEEFIWSKLASGFYGDIFKVRLKAWAETVEYACVLIVCELCMF